MRIEILGTGCPKCRALADAVSKAVADLGVAAEIVKVTDIDQIIDRGVMLTPALVIDGNIVAVGKVPAADDLKKLIGGAK